MTIEELLADMRSDIDGYRVRAITAEVHLNFASRRIGFLEARDLAAQSLLDAARGIVFTLRQGWEPAQETIEKLEAAVAHVEAQRHEPQL